LCQLQIPTGQFDGFERINVRFGNTLGEDAVSEGDIGRKTKSDADKEKHQSKARHVEAQKQRQRVASAFTSKRRFKTA
jgi:hypothetical protein